MTENFYMSEQLQPNKIKHVQSVKLEKHLL